jgi:hypothetical protein
MFVMAAFGLVRALYFLNPFEQPAGKAASSGLGHTPKSENRIR